VAILGIGNRKMSLVELAKSNSNFYVPRFEVKIENSKLPEKLANSITSVTVNEKLSEGASFTLVVSDEFDMSKEEFTWLDDDILSVGNAIEIKIGYGSKPLSMIKGKISGMKPNLFTGQPPTITLTGQDASYDSLKRPDDEKTYPNMSYSDIAQDIAKIAKLSASTDKTPKKKEPICKKNDETYFNFLKALADKVGFKVWIDREAQALCFKKPGDDKKEIMTLEWGKDIISFSPTINTVHLLSEVEVRGHNRQDPDKPIIGTAKSGTERTQESGRQPASQVAKKILNNPKKVITNKIVYSKSEADEIAKAELNKASDRFIEGDVNCIGIPQIRPGVCIELDKLGKRFSGKYFITEATHTVNNSGYRTTFKVKRNAL
jgi:phage protein D